MTCSDRALQLLAGFDWAARCGRSHPRRRCERAPLRREQCVRPSDLPGRNDQTIKECLPRKGFFADRQVPSKVREILIRRTIGGIAQQLVAGRFPQQLEARYSASDSGHSRAGTSQITAASRLSESASRATGQPATSTRKALHAHPIALLCASSRTIKRSRSPAPLTEGTPRIGDPRDPRNRVRHDAGGRIAAKHVRGENDVRFGSRLRDRDGRGARRIIRIEPHDRVVAPQQRDKRMPRVVPQAKRARRDQERAGCRVSRCAVAPDGFDLFRPLIGDGGENFLRRSHHRVALRLR